MDIYDIFEQYTKYNSNRFVDINILSPKLL